MQVTHSDVDETLRLARAELEQEIARFRVWLFGATALLSGIAIGLGKAMGGDAPVPLPFYFVGATVIAWLVRRHLEKNGVSTLATYASITLDIFVFGLSPIITGLWEEENSAVDGAFVAWIATGIIAIVIFLHSLRSDRRALVYTAALGAAVTALLLATSFFPQIDEKNRVLAVDMAWKTMDPDEIFPLLVMTIGVIAGVAGLAWYADVHARRRLRIHARVLRYVPDAAVAHVKAESTDAAIRAPGRLVEVTILASDLRGFTAMSEKLAPQEVVNQLNAYHDAMCGEIERHGGMLDKLIGDGELAVFGWKTGEPDAGADAAIRCARAMRTALASLNERRAAKSLPPLAMGIGVHTGMCVAGNIGAGKKLSFTYIGDAVNAASRIEGLTKDLGAPVLATEDVVKRLPSREGLRPLGPTAIRGKSETVVLYAVE